MTHNMFAGMLNLTQPTAHPTLVCNCAVKKLLSHWALNLSLE